jgi:hypothetical protein
MRFPYSRYTVQGTQPNTVALAFRPMVNVWVIGPTGNRDVFGRVDTGCDDTLIPQSFATALGVIQLTNPVLISGLGGGSTAQFGAVDLEISDGQSSYRWSAWMGFSSTPTPVYGIKGFLQFFRATFNGRKRYLDLFPQHYAPPPTFRVP